AGDGSAAEVVAVREPPGEHHRVDTPQVVVPVPQRHGLVAAEPDRALGVDVVERAREGDDTDPHAAHASTGDSTWTVKSSITGLESSVSAIRSISASRSGVTSPSSSNSNLLP